MLNREKAVRETDIETVGGAPTFNSREELYRLIEEGTPFNIGNRFRTDKFAPRREACLVVAKFYHSDE